MGPKAVDKSKESQRAENWDLNKLKTMTDAIIQIKTLAKYKNYNKVDWDEPKSLTDDIFGIVRSITLDIFNKKDLHWPYNADQMMAKWKTVRKQYKIAARKAHKTGNSNEDHMALLKDYPNDMGMILSHDCVSITIPGKIDTSRPVKRPANQAQSRVHRKLNKAASAEHRGKAMLVQLEKANELQETEITTQLYLGLMKQYPEASYEELKEKADIIMKLSKPKVVTPLVSSSSVAEVVESEVIEVSNVDKDRIDSEDATTIN